MKRSLAIEDLPVLAEFYCLCGSRFGEVKVVRRHWLKEHPEWDWAGWCLMYGVGA